MLPTTKLRGNDFHEAEWATDKRLQAATGDQTQHCGQPKQAIHKSSMTCLAVGTNSCITASRRLANRRDVGLSWPIMHIHSSNSRSGSVVLLGYCQKAKSSCRFSQEAGPW